MEMGEDRQGTVTVLRPVGQIDNKTCLVFEDGLRRGLDAGPTLVDFAGVEFISSAGLAVLMTAIKRAKADKGSLAVASLRPMVQEIFDRPLQSGGEGLRDGGGGHRRDAIAPPRRRRSGANIMLIRFWGTRGSLPAPINKMAVRHKLRQALVAAQGRRFANDAEIDRFLDTEVPFAVGGTYGGNSSCVEIADVGDDQYIVCDMGSGARELGVGILREKGPQKKHLFNIFQSHIHWDHIMGFPFFPPA